MLPSSLGEDLTLLAPDVLGFGDTRAADDIALTHDNRVRHLVSFLAALNIDRIHVVGNSMGGALALALADRNPELLDRLVLMGTVGIQFELTPGLDEVWGYTRSHDNMAKIIDRFVYNKSFATEDLIDLRFRASTVGDKQARYARAFSEPRQRHIDEMAPSVERLERIRNRILLIHGRDDQVIPVEETSMKLWRILPRADLAVLSECGHWTQIERAKTFLAMTRQHFAGE